ncbi:c-type cytochrome [Acidovorax sp. Leaf78]|uniref:c-type cytochrome n=1 Tax=unclassified Acidovorax TaxID=2684926 RepID=UPI0006F5A5FC|nr:c-type cytochrome [Acidovorax sp. Leaf78]KQO19492.1 cytochrome C [Acidovorax sp. Leaf78]
MSKAKMFLIVVATTGGLALAALLGGAVVIYGGLYDVAATRQHWQITHSALEVAMRQSVRLRARHIEAPPLADERMALRGAACFRDKCVQCHGAPGVAQSDIGLGLQPQPGPLVDAKLHWQPRELYWVVRHGLKMTGMPAWEYRLADGEIWDVVAFMQRLPELSAPQYAQWQERASATAAVPACGRGQAVPAPVVTAEPARASASATAPAVAFAVNVERGRQALHQYACASCHSIPGVTGPAAYVGPPLDGFGKREIIAGVLPNSPDNLERWLVHTQSIKPGTAMPELGVAPRDARDMAAFLATLR